MLPSEELLQSIDIIAQNAAKNGVKIYTSIVTAVGDNNTCSIRANGKTHSNIAYYGDTPIVNKSYRVFCPNGSMNQAFIITGGGSSGGSTYTLPIASADVLGGIKVGAGLTISTEGTLSATGGGTADAVEWNNVLDKPTTVAGYGITDAKIDGNNIVLGSNTMTPYTANNTPPYPVTSVNSKTGAVQLNATDVGALPDTTVIPSKTSQLNNDSGYITELPIASSTQLGGIKVGAGLSVSTEGTLSVTGGGTADAVEWNNVLDKPTTIAGYGITDAKIDNGTITLGDKTITPLTSAPVTSVNSKTGAVVLGASDVGALPADIVIPTVNNATLTIRRNSVDVGSFTANSANDVNIDINVPTDKSDIGLGNVDNVKQYSASNPPPYPVTSVNGKTGDVTIDVSGGGTQVKIVRW